MIDETTPIEKIPPDHVAYAALHRETQELIKKLQDQLATHIKDENSAFHDVVNIQVRLEEGDRRMTRIEESIEDQRVRGDRIEHNIKGIRTSLNANNENTAELLEIIRSAKGLFRLIGRISSGLRRAILWAFPLITAILSLWYVITDHQKKL